MSSLFYRSEIQAVLMFGLESWDMSDAMMRMVESTNVGFLQQITGKWSRRKADRSWETLTDEDVLWTVGIQSVDMYKGLRKATLE